LSSRSVGWDSCIGGCDWAAIIFTIKEFLPTERQANSRMATSGKFPSAQQVPVTWRRRKSARRRKSVWHLAHGALFATDDTQIGTQQLTTNGNPGVAHGTFDGTTYFYRSGQMSSSGAFWKSNGTVAGTINLGHGNSESQIYSFAQFDGALFYAGPLTKLTPGIDEFSTVATAPVNVRHLTVAGDTLYFLGQDSDSGPYRLWKLTTANGTPEAVAQLGPSAQNFTSIGSTLYFTYFSSAGGTELWKSNGTNAGTVQVKDINPGSSSSFPMSLTNVGGTLFFTATTAANCRTLEIRWDGFWHCPGEGYCPWQRVRCSGSAV